MLGSLLVAAAIAPVPLGLSVSTVEVRGVPLEIHTYKPSTFRGERMILVLHGTLRNADEYCADSASMADRFGALVVAPKFDEQRFPSRLYQRGGIVGADGQAQPPEKWTYAYIPAIARLAMKREAATMPYWILGHSAGGQFIVRMAAFQDTGAQRLVAANAGSHLFPTWDAPFGYGFGGLPAELASEDRLRRYLAAPLTLFQGTADDRSDQYFDQSAEAMKQGAGRYQRGWAAFRAAQTMARSRGWPFGWRIVEAKGVGHDHTKMFNHGNCAIALFGHPHPDWDGASW